MIDWSIFKHYAENNSILQRNLRSLVFVIMLASSEFVQAPQGYICDMKKLRLTKYFCGKIYLPLNVHRRFA